MSAIVTALVEALTARISEERRVPARPCSAAALERLARHAWPGNVRELENALERALVARRDAVAVLGSELANRFSVFQGVDLLLECSHSGSPVGLSSQRKAGYRAKMRLRVRAG